MRVKTLSGGTRGTRKSDSVGIILNGWMPCNNVFEKHLIITDYFSSSFVLLFDFVVYFGTCFTVKSNFISVFAMAILGRAIS